MKQKTTLTKLLVSTAMIAGCALVAITIFQTAVHASTIGPTDCSNDKPQNCTMSRRSYDSIVNSWCSLASPGKVDDKDPKSANIQDVCKLTFLTWVSSTNGALGFDNPDYCTNTPKDRESDAQEYCFVIIKHNTAFYGALTKLLNECGIADKQDAACASEHKQDFLKTQKTKGVPFYSDPKAANQDKNFNAKEAPNQTPFMKRIATYIRWLVVGIGILSVFGVIVAGIQYSAAQDNPQAIAAAKGRITNIVIGILIYLFMFAALQWLIPGGIF